MAIDKTKLPPECSPQSVTSLLGAKTITAATAYRHGSVSVIELAFSDSTTNYIKAGPNGMLEIGGTLELGSGVKVAW